MVRKIRYRGHVIRLFGIEPSTSKTKPPSCPTCGSTYNDGNNRKCIYLCCEFEDCLDCVFNQNMFLCHKFKPKLRKKLVLDDNGNGKGENLKTAFKLEPVKTNIFPISVSDNAKSNLIISEDNINTKYERFQLDLKCSVENVLPEKHRNAVVLLEKIAQPTTLSHESQVMCKQDRPVVLVAKRRSSRLIRGNNSKA